MIKDRLYYLDNITGLFIIHMIFVCHIGILDKGFYSSNTILISCKLLFGCFMSWFFFKSGMFYKPTDNIRKFITNLSKKLLIPYVIFCTISYPIDLLIRKNDTCVAFTFIDYLCPLKDIILHEATISNCPIWFLLTLFFVQVIVQFLNMRYNMITICVLGGLVAFSHWLFADFGIYPKCLPSYIGNIGNGILFYSLGYILKDKQYSQKIIIIATVIYIIHFFIQSKVTFRWNTSNLLPLADLYNLAGCLVINNVFKRYLNRRIPVLTHIGQNSMVYYLTHYMLLSSLFTFVFTDNNVVDNYLYACLITIIYLVVMDYLFRIKRLSVVIGK